MKKLLLAFLLIALALPGAGQTVHKRNAIAIGYSPASTSDIAGMALTLLAKKINPDAIIYRPGTYSAEYYHMFGNLVSVGGAFCYYRLSDIENGKEVAINNYTVLLGTRLSWYQRQWFCAYSKFAAGITYRDWQEESKKVGFDFQASLLGVETGPPWLRLFLEAGVGAQGFAAAGLRFGF